MEASDDSKFHVSRHEVSPEMTKQALEVPADQQAHATLVNNNLALKMRMKSNFQDVVFLRLLDIRQVTYIASHKVEPYNILQHWLC